MPGTSPAVLASMIESTLFSRRVPVRVSALYDGPQVTTFSVVPALGYRLEDVTRMQSAIAVSCGVESVRLTPAPGKLLAEVPKSNDDRTTLHTDTLEQHFPIGNYIGKWQVPLGPDTLGNVTVLDLSDERMCHVLLGGSTGCGKTLLLRWILYRLLMQQTPEHLQLIAVDPKNSELAAFASSAHLMLPIARNAVEIGTVTDRIQDILTQRLRTGVSSPKVIIVFEEVADLAQTCPAALALVGRIAQVGRSLGIQLIATTQQPGTKAMGQALANFPCRLLGRVTSATLTYGAAGRSKTLAHQLLGRGDFIILTGDGVRRFQAPLVRSKILASIPRRVVEPMQIPLPRFLAAADEAHDPRGGNGRASIDYDIVARALSSSPDMKARDLQARFSIGRTRAERIVEAFSEFSQQGATSEKQF
jgi:DNA segregation ATPase FtsK/SpoIIIE, S-DNA-T family